MGLADGCLSRGKILGFCAPQTLPLLPSSHVAFLLSKDCTLGGGGREGLYAQSPPTFFEILWVFFLTMVGVGV